MKKILKIGLITLLSLILVMFFVLFSYIYKINKSIDYNQNILINANTKVELFDNENNSLSNYNEQISKVNLTELPSYVSECFISIEDKDFYNHKGLNYKRIAKALVSNIKSMRAKEGASTISQQLVKNTFLSSDKTLNRKIKEMLITRKMEKQFSKEDILETYLNVIYFGNNCYGLEQASKCYFNKSAKELTIAQSATLAGIIKSPKLYSPIYNKENCLKRRNVVLKELLKDKKITQEEYENAINEDLVLSLSSNIEKNFYEQAVLQEASEILNISEKDLACSGYKIFTYYDKNDQYSLKTAINNKDNYHVNSYGNVADSLGIILDNSTGGVTALYGKSLYDIVNMKRSPGSAIKPVLVYAPAIENGVISPETPILDEKTSFGGYSPQNVSNKYYGYISARKSLEKSLNIPAIKIMQYTGLQKCINTAEKCGITFDKQDNNYAIALGGFTNGLTAKQLVNSFIPFSNGGNFIKSSFVRKICNKDGVAVYTNPNLKTQVFSEETAYLVTDMLKTSTKTGTSSRLKDLPYEVAGKTGTNGLKNTNYNLDVWSIAYTTNKTCGIWLGNSTNQKEFMLEGCNNGGTYCTNILKQTFENIYSSNAPKNFEKPDGVAEVYIDSIELENNHCLKIADDNTPDIFKETALFNKKYLPTEKSKNFSELAVVKLKVNLINNKPALTFSTLPQCEYKIYRIEEDKTTLLKTIKNKRGNVEFLDNEVNLDTQYEYFIEVKAVNYSNNTFSKTIKSNSVKIFIPSLISNNNAIINRNFAFA